MKNFVTIMKEGIGHILDLTPIGDNEYELEEEGFRKQRRRRVSEAKKKKGFGSKEAEGVFLGFSGAIYGVSL